LNEKEKSKQKRLFEEFGVKEKETNEISLLSIFSNQKTKEQDQTT
jgi:hypothetical protein